MFVTTDVTFFETKNVYFSDHHLQGENESEDSFFHYLQIETSPMLGSKKLETPVANPSLEPGLDATLETLVETNTTSTKKIGQLLLCH